MLIMKGKNRAREWYLRTQDMEYLRAQKYILSKPISYVLRWYTHNLTQLLEIYDFFLNHSISTNTRLYGLDS
jgi:hypothetical protein